MKRTVREKAAIAMRLREARERAGVTKEEAAAAADAQPAAIISWERGSSLPTLVQLKGLVACYGVTCHYVLFGHKLIELDQDEAAELTVAVRSCSANLQRKVDLILAVAASACDRHAA